MDLCLAAEQRPWTRVSKKWWEQEGLTLGGMQTASCEAEQEDIGRGGGGGVDGAETETE